MKKRATLNLWLLLLVGVCGLSLWFGRGLFLPETNLPKFNRPVSNLATNLTDPTAHILLLNGTETSGLARQFTLLVSHAGCVAEGVGNAGFTDCKKSFMVNRRLADNQARELARKFGSIPVLKEWDKRSTEDIVLVLGQDYEEVKARLLENSSN